MATEVCHPRLMTSVQDRTHTQELLANTNRMPWVSFLLLFLFCCGGDFIFLSENMKMGR